MSSTPSLPAEAAPASLPINLRWEEIGFAPISAVSEEERLRELRLLELLDTQSESRFDQITQLAAVIFEVPIAYVALLEDDRQWLKSSIGLEEQSLPRDATFCQFTIRRNEPFIVPDTWQHPLLRVHPAVTTDPFVRFYGGVPLKGPLGGKVGTFCIVDRNPRTFSPRQLEQLTIFAGLVERELNLSRLIQSQAELLKTKEELLLTKQNLDRELDQAAKYVRLMLPPPLVGRESIDWEFYPSQHLGGDGLGYRRIDDDRLAFYVLDVTGHGLGAALLAVTALEFLRSRSPQIDFGDPSAVFARLNQIFQMKEHDGKYFSVWYGVYSRRQGQIRYANAGHPPPFILRRQDGIGRLGQTELGDGVLGITPEIAPREMTLDFPPGSELILFTDGLYDYNDPALGRRSHAEFFASLAKIEAGPDFSPWEIIFRAMQEARAANLFADDVTLLRFVAHGEVGQG